MSAGNGDAWAPEEVTMPDLEVEAVRELFDADERRMLGKMARHQVRTTQQVTELSKRLNDWIDESRQERKLLRKLQRSSSMQTVGLLGLVEAAIHILKSAGVLK